MDMLAFILFVGAMYFLVSGINKIVGNTPVQRRLRKEYKERFGRNLRKDGIEYLVTGKRRFERKETQISKENDKWIITMHTVRGICIGIYDEKTKKYTVTLENELVDQGEKESIILFQNLMVREYY